MKNKMLKDFTSDSYAHPVCISWLGFTLKKPTDRGGFYKAIRVRELILGNLRHKIVHIIHLKSPLQTEEGFIRQ